MSKYRKKPVEIEAVQYLGFEQNGEECELFLGDDFESHLPSENKILVRTLEGELTASAGDFLIRGVKGEHYPCKPDIFAATYDEGPARPNTAYGFAAFYAELLDEKVPDQLATDLTTIMASQHRGGLQVRPRPAAPAEATV